MCFMYIYIMLYNISQNSFVESTLFYRGNYFFLLLTIHTVAHFSAFQNFLK